VDYSERIEQKAKMEQLTMPQKERGRRDHILPVGYLEGFCGPNKLLEVFHIEEKRWFPQKTENVAWQDGFYDYSEGAAPDQTADQAFYEYETKFPKLRRELIASNFSDWRKHLDFLIRYLNMIRVRTPLFREQFLQALAQTPPMVIDEVLEKHPHATKPGMVSMKAKIKPMAETGEELKTAYRNFSISKMRADMQAVPQHFFDFDWCLRFTMDPKKPIITADDAIRLEGPDPRKFNPLRHMDTVIYFPLCWQACLIGRPHVQTPKTKIFSSSRLMELEAKYLASLCRFAYSPIKLSL
jgi:hypothetical protein